MKRSGAAVWVGEWTDGRSRVSRGAREPGQGWRDTWGSRKVREGQEAAPEKLREAPEREGPV